MALVCLPELAHADGELRTRQQAIRDGREAMDGEFPALVGVRSVESLGGAGKLCTGTLIAPNLVLTARHCVAQASGCGNFGSDFAIGGFLIVFAEDLAAPDSQDHVLTVSEVIVNEGNRVCGDDMALLILSSNVLTTVATPATPRVGTPAAANERYTALGYGDTTNGDDQPFLLRVLEDRTIECYGSACSRSQIRSTEFAGDDGACGGDSGGPALDEQGRVVGVASRVLRGGCRDVVYSDVSSFRDLIVGAAERAAMLGGYPVPDWAGGGNTTPEDSDGDGILDADDICPGVADPNQLDFDQDGSGDACDPDDDNDNVPDTGDNCPMRANPQQSDLDDDGIGDPCDPTPLGEDGPDMDISTPDMGMGPGGQDIVDMATFEGPMEPEVFMLEGEAFCSLVGIPMRTPVGGWVFVLGLVAALVRRRAAK